MKNLVKVSAVSLVALTLTFGSISSAMAGSMYQSNKRVYKSFKPSSSKSRFAKPAPARTSMKRLPLRTRYTPIGVMQPGGVKVPPKTDQGKPGTANGPVKEGIKWIVKKVGEAIAVETVKDAVTGTAGDVKDYIFPPGIPAGGQSGGTLDSGPLR